MSEGRKLGDYVSVGSYTLLGEARLAQSALEGEGIAVHLQGIEFASVLPHMSNAVGGVTVFVPAAECRARERDPRPPLRRAGDPRGRRGPRRRRSRRRSERGGRSTRLAGGRCRARVPAAGPARRFCLASLCVRAADS